MQNLTDSLVLKKCSACKKEKRIGEFWINKKIKSGINSFCKQCGKEKKKKFIIKNPDYHKIKNKENYEKNLEKVKSRTIKKRYSLTDSEVIDFTNIKSCEICGKEKTQTKRGRGCHAGAIVIDHNHETGKLRGFICQNCNSALGQVNDSIDILQKMINYLRDRNNA